MVKPQQSRAVGSQIGSQPSEHPTHTLDGRSLVAMRFTAAVIQEPPWYVARCLEVEVTSQGETVEDALRNLREALELHFEDWPLPDHIKTPIIAPVDIPA